MNNQKLISILQSRIAKRKKMITFFLKHASRDKSYNKQLAMEQKQDKQIMKALIDAERKYKYHANTCHRLTQEVLKLRRQLASYKLTGKPYISGNAN